MTVIPPYYAIVALRNKSRRHIARRRSICCCRCDRTDRNRICELGCEGVRDVLDVARFRIGRGEDASIWRGKYLFQDFFFA